MSKRTYEGLPLYLDSVIYCTSTKSRVETCDGKEIPVCIGVTLVL